MMKNIIVFESTLTDLGKVIHQPRPTSSTINIFNEKLDSESLVKILDENSCSLFEEIDIENLGEQMDPYQRKQQRRANLLKRYGPTGSPAPAPDYHREEDELGEGWEDDQE